MRWYFDMDKLIQVIADGKSSLFLSPLFVYILLKSHQDEEEENKRNI